jgi:hypothetical protein
MNLTNRTSAELLERLSIHPATLLHQCPSVSVFPSFPLMSIRVYPRPSVSRVLCLVFHARLRQLKREGES